MKLKAQKKINISQIVLHLFIILLMIPTLYPLFLMLIRSVKDITQEQLVPYGITFPFHFENFSFAWLYVKPYLFNSVFYSLTISIGTVFVCAVTAYGFSFYRFPFKETLFLMILAIIMVPSIVSLVPKYVMIANQFRLINNPLGVILPSIFGNVPFGTFLLRIFFDNLPKECFEAAEMDGANGFRKFFVIAIPLAMPIITALFINILVGAWNDLLWPRLMLTKENLQTIPVGLVGFTKNFMSSMAFSGPPMAGYVIVSLPLMCAFAVASKQFIKGLSSGAFKF